MSLLSRKFLFLVNKCSVSNLMIKHNGQKTVFIIVDTHSLMKSASLNHLWLWHMLTENSRPVCELAQSQQSRWTCNEITSKETLFQHQICLLRARFLGKVVLVMLLQQRYNMVYVLCIKDLFQEFTHFRY